MIEMCANKLSLIFDTGGMDDWETSSEEEEEEEEEERKEEGEEGVEDVPEMTRRFEGMTVDPQLEWHDERLYRTFGSSADDWWQQA